MEKLVEFILFTGPMFSGKTENLLNIAKRYSIANKKMFLFKPKKDSRFGDNIIMSHNEISTTAIPIISFDDVLPHIANKPDNFISAIFIDEIQFIINIKKTTIFYILEELKISIYCSGLILDSFRNLFPNMIPILSYANIKYQNAVCTGCGNFDAIYTHRKSENKDVVFVGGKGEYTSLCSTCFVEFNKERL